MARILVVDDEPLIRKQIARILVKQGHVVHQASNAKSALKFAGEKVFDLSLVIIIFQKKTVCMFSSL